MLLISMIQILFDPFVEFFQTINEQKTVISFLSVDYEQFQKAEDEVVK